MHQTQFSEKIPYGGFSQIRSHFSLYIYIIDNIILGMFTKARYVLMTFTHFECVHDIYSVWVDVCVCARVHTSVREEFKQ